MVGYRDRKSEGVETSFLLIIGFVFTFLSHPFIKRSSQTLHYQQVTSHIHRGRRQMESSQRILRERPPKKKKERKEKNPDVFASENSAPAEVIRVHIPRAEAIHVRLPNSEQPKSATPAPKSLRKANSRTVASATTDLLPLPGTETREDYLLVVEDAIDSILLAFQIHSKQHPQPTKEQKVERKLLDDTCIVLQMITKNLINEDYEESLQSPEGATTALVTRSFTDASTSTTTTTTCTEDLSLAQRIQSLESKLDQLLSKPSYASIVQRNNQPETKQEDTLPLERISKSPGLDNTRFVVEVRNPVPKDFNPLPLREKLNAMLPPHASRFTAIRRSQKGNLVCYTLSHPSSTISCFEEWSGGIEFDAIWINAEDKWLRRILYLPHACPTASILEAELTAYNPGLHLASSPRLLSPTVALLLFPSDRKQPEHIFVFATYPKLANYILRTSGDPKKHNHKRKTPNEEPEISIVEGNGKEKAIGEGEGGVPSDLSCNWEMEMEISEEDAVMQERESIGKITNKTVDN